MQLHSGALRDHNELVSRRFVADRGGDIPVAHGVHANLRPLLTLLEMIRASTDRVHARRVDVQSRAGAARWSLSGECSSVPRGGSTIRSRGFVAFSQAGTTETAGIENTAGFTDDTRAFCSIPARHDPRAPCRRERISRALWRGTSSARPTPARWRDRWHTISPSALTNWVETRRGRADSTAEERDAGAIAGDLCSGR